jgi:hypothetical protein
MKTLFGWGIKLGLLGLVVATMTGNIKIKLPETVLGYEVPREAQQWIDRNAQISDLGAKASAGFKGIADSIK